jgi:hypothetical protein
MRAAKRQIVVMRLARRQDHSVPWRRLLGPAQIVVRGSRSLPRWARPAFANRSPVVLNLETKPMIQRNRIRGRAYPRPRRGALPAPNKRKRPPGRIGGRFWPARGLECGQSPADATMG